jgi:hypothetical protein
MATLAWDPDVRNALRVRFDVGQEGKAWMGLVVAEKRVRVERVTAFDAEWLLILSRVAKEEDLAHRDALTCNMRLAVGALALDRGHYELKAIYELAALELPVLERAIHDVAREATRLQEWVKARTALPDVLSFFTE